MSPARFIKATDGFNGLAELELLYKREMPNAQSTLAPAARYHFKILANLFAHNLR